MDEGEKTLLEGVAGRRHWPGRGQGWAALRGTAIGSLWGRSAGDVEIDAVDSWVLRAEASR
jgi:hypothetical protein